MKINISDTTAFGSAFAAMNELPDTLGNVVSNEATTQVLTIAISLVISIFAKLVTKVIGNLFSRKKLTLEEAIDIAKEDLRKTWEKSGYSFTEDELQEKAENLATSLVSKLVKQSKK